MAKVGYCVKPPEKHLFETFVVFFGDFPSFIKSIFVLIENIVIFEVLAFILNVAHEYSVSLCVTY